MREILFRGQAANRDTCPHYRTKYKNGDWVIGLLTDHANYAGFAEMTNINGVSGIEVDRNTVGQYTGLTDKNDDPIYEGDIVRYVSKAGTPADYEVLWSEKRGAWMLRYRDSKNERLSVAAHHRMIEIIGNIHDNPELLEVAEDG